MGTKNNPGDFDCYENAEDDEPMFILLARDERAPDIVRSWANAYKVKHCGFFNKKWTSSAHEEKYHESLRCANDMEVWKKANPDK